MTPRPDPDAPERISPRTRSEWRTWLEAHHADRAVVWVVYAKKDSGLPTVGYDAAVEEALCFGWIDGKVNRLDDERFMQRFTPRRAGSTWSRTNKARVAQMVEAGRMTPAGRAVIDRAKRDGSWTILDDVEALVVPADLRAALDADPVAAANFEAFAPSRKKPLLFWVAGAKRPATRAKRIAETVRRAAANAPFGG
jgi:uncharacterized protein YdeI (YjbR/CyaY-like superfamily)